MKNVACQLRKQRVLWPSATAAAPRVRPEGIQGGEEDADPR